MKRVKITLSWREGAAVGLWGMVFLASALLFAATSFAVKYSSTATLAESCRAARGNACVNYGRTASVICYAYSACLLLGALQISRIANAPTPRGGRHWRLLVWVSEFSTGVNPTVTRFALATSLISAPTMALYLGWFYPLRQSALVRAYGVSASQPRESQESQGPHSETPYAIANALWRNGVLHSWAQRTFRVPHMGASLDCVIHHRGRDLDDCREPRKLEHD